MLKEYLVDQSTVPWRALQKEGWPLGKITRLRHLLDPADGGPEAINTQHPEGYGSDAHLHLGAQFQVLLHGSLCFANYRLDAPAVHYTDHSVAYGPFTSTNKEDIFVLHVQRANAIQSKDHETAMRVVNRSGREIAASAEGRPWEPFPGHPGVRRKVLIPETAGPSAEILECPAGGVVPQGTTLHGRYEIVMSGSVRVSGRELGPRCLRFTRGDGRPAPMRAGSQGATVFVATFDKDAEWQPPADLNVGYGFGTLPVIAGE